MTDAKLTSISIAIDKAFTAAGHVCKDNEVLGALIDDSVENGNAQLQGYGMAWRSGIRHQLVERRTLPDNRRGSADQKFSRSSRRRHRMLDRNAGTRSGGRTGRPGRLERASDEYVLSEAQAVA